MYVKINHFTNSLTLIHNDNIVSNICNIRKKEIIEITGKPASGKSLLCELYIQNLINNYKCCLISSNGINILKYQEKKIDVDIILFNNLMLDKNNFILLFEYLNSKYDVLFFDNITYYKELFTEYFYMLYNTTIFYVTDIRFNLNFNRSLYKSTSTTPLLLLTKHRILCEKVHDFQNKIEFQFTDLLACDEKVTKYIIKKEI